MSVASHFRWDGSNPPLRFQFSSTAPGERYGLRTTPKNNSERPILTGAAAPYLHVLSEIDLEVLAHDQQVNALSHHHGGGDGTGGNASSYANKRRFDTTTIESDVHRAWLAGKREDILVYCQQYHERLGELQAEEEAAHAANSTEGPTNEALQSHEVGTVTSPLPAMRKKDELPEERMSDLDRRHRAVLARRSQR